MTLFEKNSDLKFEMKNRFIRSATHEALATTDGRPTEKLKNVYVRLAEGGVGAIITGFAAIQQNGKTPGDSMLMIDRDDLITDYRALTDEIHNRDCRIILQVVHCGSQTTAESIGEKKVAPSAIKSNLYRDSTPRELSDNEIEDIINNFVNSVVRAEKAGFDGVQIHGAHGYLLSSFLTSNRNKRNDKWGGSLENRFRIIKEIFLRARKLLPDYPLFIKISAYDFQKNGLNVKDSITVCKWLEELGCDGIEISSGIPEDGFGTIRCNSKPVDAIMHYMAPLNRINSSFIRGLLKFGLSIITKNHKPLYNYNLNAAKEITKNISIPVILVGGIRDIKNMESIINSGYAQYISLCRPLILEPTLVNKFKDKKQTESKCIECGYCLIGLTENPLQCYYGKLK